MKTNKEIKDYLEPYITLPGVTQDNLVEYEQTHHTFSSGDYYIELKVYIDAKTGFLEHFPTDASQKIKAYLRSHGFSYKESEGVYRRICNK